MFSLRRVISHFVLWSFVAVGVFFAFSFISPAILFKKSLDKWFVIVPLVIFLVYHFLSACYWRNRLRPRSGLETHIIRVGVYAKCAHPTCTSLVILSWIIFFYFPDTRILVSVAWLTLVIVTWIKIEKSFFIGRRLKAETKDPEPS